MNQEILNRAVQLATEAALAGNPIEVVIWLPPRTGSEDSGGSFVVLLQEKRTGSD
jgi:hypothetical protein